MPSRKIEDLIPEAQDAYAFFKNKMDEGNIPFIVTSTYRSQEEQDEIYAQGRTKPGKVVTWTRHSRHTERDAFDIVILRDGKPVWDVKVDIDKDDIPDYKEAGRIGETVGFEWGGRWKTPDYPHFQLRRA